MQMLRDDMQERYDEYFWRFNAINDELDNIELYITNINECTKWFNEFESGNNKYNPDPKVEYKYGYSNEDGNNDSYYYDALGINEMIREEPPGRIVEPDTWTLKTTEYDMNQDGKAVPVKNSKREPCLDDKYINEGENVCITADHGNSDTVTYLRGIEDSGYYYDVPTKPETFDNYTYMRDSIEISYSFTSPNGYATLYPSGAVVLREEYDASFSKSEYVTFDGLPVQIETSNGPHKFTFTFSDIGEYFDREEETGRIFDSDNNTNTETVLGKYNEKEQQIFTGPSEGKEYNYVCYYRVNQSTCQTCTPTCDDDDCSSTTEEECLGDNCCPYCNPECIDCIYSIKEYQLDITPIPTRTTSLPSGTSPSPGTQPGSGGYSLVTVVNPNGIEYVPYNWNIWTTYDDYGERYNIINDKAKLTINEIQTYGELIYVSRDLGTNNVFENDPRIEGIGSFTEDFGVLKVVMTPSLAQEIRNYNSSAKSYTNSTLTCYDYSYHGAKFEKVFCYSSFLDQYADNPNFTFSTKRIQDSNARDGRTDQGDYWVTFLSQTDSNGQNLGDKYTGSIVKIQNGDMEKIGGPAWK